MLPTTKSLTKSLPTGGPRLAAHPACRGARRLLAQPGAAAALLLLVGSVGFLTLLLALHRAVALGRRDRSGDGHGEGSPSAFGAAPWQQGTGGGTLFGSGVVADGLAGGGEAAAAPRYSTYHCIGRKFDDDFRRASCRFTNVCWNVDAEQVEYFTEPAFEGESRRAASKLLSLCVRGHPPRHVWWAPCPARPRARYRRRLAARRPAGGVGPGRAPAGGRLPSQLCALGCGWPPQCRTEQPGAAPSCPSTPGYESEALPEATKPGRCVRAM